MASHIPMRTRSQLHLKSYSNNNLTKSSQQSNMLFNFVLSPAASNIISSGFMPNTLKTPKVTRQKTMELSENSNAVIEIIPKVPAAIKSKQPKLPPTKGVNWIILGNCKANTITDYETSQNVAESMRKKRWKETPTIKLMRTNSQPQFYKTTKNLNKVKYANLMRSSSTMRVQTAQTNSSSTKLLEMELQNDEQAKMTYKKHILGVMKKHHVFLKIKIFRLR